MLPVLNHCDTCVVVDAEELSRLLCDPERRYSTLSCEFSVRFHPDVAAKAERRQIEAGNASLVGRSAEEAVEDWEDLGGKVLEWRALVWVRRPDCYREQDFDRDDPQLLMRDGSAWWCRSAMSGVSSGSYAGGVQPAVPIGRYEMCVMPERYPSRLDFDALGAGQRAGREVIRAKARRLPPRPPAHGTSRIIAINLGDWFGGLPVFANGDDDFMVEIDAATGVILRIASVFENQDWMVVEAVEVVFDEPLPQDRFTIPQDRPPEGTVTSRRGLFRSRH